MRYAYKEELNYLLRYHHNLSIQFSGLEVKSDKLNKQLSRVEKRIEEILELENEFQVKRVELSEEHIERLENELDKYYKGYQQNLVNQNKVEHLEKKVNGLEQQNKRYREVLERLSNHIDPYVSELAEQALEGDNQ